MKYLRQRIIFIALSGLLLVLPWAQIHSSEDILSAPSVPVETIDRWRAPANQAANIQFRIISDDPDTYSGQITFRVDSPTTIINQLVAFISTVEQSPEVVRQISLPPSADHLVWSSTFDTSELANGIYLFEVGVMSDTAEPIIWQSADSHSVFNVSGKPKSDEPPQSKIFYQTEQPTDTSLIEASSTEAVVTTTTISVVSEAEPLVSPWCGQLGLSDAQQCQEAARWRLDSDCRQAGLVTFGDCEEYKRKMYLLAACEPEKIYDQAQCQDYIWQKFESEVNCGSLNQSECNTRARAQWLGQLLSNIQIADRVGALLRSDSGKAITSRQLADQLSSGSSGLTLPFEPTDKVTVRLVPSFRRSLLTADNLVSTVPLIITLDSDSDGLSDDAEIRYGTKADQADSDNDGYIDGDEVRHNYNPLGSDSLVAQRSAIDLAMFAGLPLEQPLVSGQLDESLNQIEAENFVNHQGLRFFGTAKPLETVTLFIYSSLPIMQTAQTDEQGHWQINLPLRLSDGIHTAYLSQLDDQGKIIAKSREKTIFIQRGQTVSPQEFVQPKPRVAGIEIDRSIVSWIWWGAGTLAAIILALLLAVVLRQRRKIPMKTRLLSR